jgi:hypothetical protein
MATLRGNGKHLVKDQSAVCADVDSDGSELQRPPHYLNELAIVTLIEVADRWEEFSICSINLTSGCV